MKSYDTITEAVSDLKARGYAHDFDIQADCIHCKEKEICMHPEEFEVDEVYRFEGDSDPGDENVVYAISSDKYQIKGISVSAFGTYADIASADLLRKLSFRH